MPTITAQHEERIDAPASRVYGLLADYRVGHPSILPEEYFGPLVVESGGEGEGTVIRFTMKAMGKEHTVRARITEPEPGRVLHETAIDNGALTSFVVTPAGENACTVSIRTQYTKAGVAGFIEKLIVPSFLRKVYRAELAKLRDVAGRG